MGYKKPQCVKYAILEKCVKQRLNKYSVLNKSRAKILALTFLLFLSVCESRRSVLRNGSRINIQGLENKIIGYIMYRHVKHDFYRERK